MYLEAPTDEAPGILMGNRVLRAGIPNWFSSSFLIPRCFVLFTRCFPTCFFLVHVVCLFIFCFRLVLFLHSRLFSTAVLFTFVIIVFLLPTCLFLFTPLFVHLFFWGPVGYIWVWVNASWGGCPARWVWLLGFVFRLEVQLFGIDPARMPTLKPKPWLWLRKSMWSFVKTKMLLGNYLAFIPLC